MVYMTENTLVIRVAGGGGGVQKVELEKVQLFRTRVPLSWTPGYPSVQ